MNYYSIFICDHSKNILKNVSPKQILRDICSATGISFDAVCEKSRKRELVEIRQIYYAVAPISYSLEKVGNVVGADHATVIHGRRTACEVFPKKLKDVVREIYPLIDLENLIKGKLWRK